MRRLLLIPIVHSQEDMGSLGRQLLIDRASEGRVQAYWTEVRRQVQALQLDWPTIKVYQDGLPDTDLRILRKTREEVQSPNYDLLRWLVAQGADLVGTEAPTLLKEEYDLLQAVLRTTDDAARMKARRAYAGRADSLLAERDAYIARRIAETLPSGGVGLLFIGQAHQVARYLPADVEIRKLP